MRRSKSAFSSRSEATYSRRKVASRSSASPLSSGSTTDGLSDPRRVSMSRLRSPKVLLESFKHEKPKDGVSTL